MELIEVDVKEDDVVHHNHEDFVLIDHEAVLKAVIVVELRCC